MLKYNLLSLINLPKVPLSLLIELIVVFNSVAVECKVFKVFSRSSLAKFEVAVSVFVNIWVIVSLLFFRVPVNSFILSNAFANAPVSLLSIVCKEEEEITRLAVVLFRFDIVPLILLLVFESSTSLNPSKRGSNGLTA